MEQKKIKVNLNKPEVVKRFLQVVRTFLSDIDIMTENAVLDAKSIMGVYALDLSNDTYVRIISDDVEECRRFEIEYTGYLEEDIRVLKLQRARFNRARKKKELDRLIKEKEMLLNDINAMNERKIQKRSRIKNEYSKEMFEEANKFLNDINDKLFS